MSPRLLRNLAVALVAGIALWWGLAWLGRSRGPAPLAGAGIREKIARIELSPSLVLENTDGWRLVSPSSGWSPVPANMVHVNRLLDSIAELRLEEVITESPSRHAAFEVDDASGTRLRAVDKGGNALLDIIVGKAAADGSRVYVRRPAEPAVHLGSGWDPAWVRRSAQDWCDRTLLRFDPKAVSTVEIRGKGGKVSLVRVGAGLDPARSSWTVNGLPASTTAVENFVNSFSGAWADEVVLGSAPAAGLGLDTPRVVLTITDSLGQHELRAGAMSRVRAGLAPAPSVKLRYVRATPSGLLFRVSDAAIQTWDKSPKAFR